MSHSTATAAVACRADGPGGAVVGGAPPPPPPPGRVRRPAGVRRHVLTLPLVRKAQRPRACRFLHGLIRQQAAEKHLDPALDRGGDLRRDEVRPSTSPAGRSGTDADPPADRASSSPTARAPRRSRPPISERPGEHRLRQLLPALPPRRVPRQRVLALAAYNGGEANVDRWVARPRQAAALTVDEIPFPETRAYVLKRAAGTARLPPDLRQPARLQHSGLKLTAGRATGARPAD